MARTVTEIQEAIQATFIASPTLIDAYGLDTTKSFSEQFSKVSLEAIWIYIIAYALHLHEQVIDLLKKEVEQTLESNALCSIPWYHAQARNFQLGDDLLLDEKTYRYGYASVDESKQIIKYAAIRQIQEEEVTKLKVYVSKADKVPLSDIEIKAFTRYLNQIGAAGVHYTIVSLAATALSFKLNVNYNPLVLDPSGTRISGGGKPVDEAIAGYLNSILYGGIFNRTKLIDSIQRAEGVTDVVLTEVKAEDEVSSKQNIESPGGAFTYNNTYSQISYSASNYDY